MNKRLLGLAAIVSSAFPVAVKSSEKELIISENFEGASGYFWQSRGGNWRIAEEEGNRFCRQGDFSTENAPAENSQGFSGKNYSVSCDVRVNGANDFEERAGIIIYKTERDNSCQNSTPNYLLLSLNAKRQSISFTCREKDSVSYGESFIDGIEAGRWYNLQLEVENGVARAYLNGEQFASDFFTHIQGGYTSINTMNCSADFDNFQVYVFDSD